MQRIDQLARVSSILKTLGARFAGLIGGLPVVFQVVSKILDRHLLRLSFGL
jgi:hypothetical protein